MVYQLAGGVILNQKNQVLLVHNHKTDTWTFPKGHLKEEENEFEAAQREIEEETRLKNLRFLKKLPAYQRKTKEDPNKIKSIQLFLFRVDEAIALQSQGGEIKQSGWFELSEAMERLSYKKDKIVLSRYVK